MEFTILDNGLLKLVDVWGSDARIVEAARMSTNKGFIGWGTPEKPGDEKLLKYLWTNNHSSPFEQCGFSVEVQAPIMVFREWHRHRTQSYNELSGRYTQMPNIHYIPAKERVRAQSKINKQGTDEQTLDPAIVEEFLRRTKEDQDRIYANYEWALNQGIAKEIARINTPVARYSRMVASANLLNWLKFLKLRMASNAQFEIREYANAIAKIVEDKFPITWGIVQSPK